MASHLSKPPYSQELRDSLHYTIELEQEGTVGLTDGWTYFFMIYYFQILATAKNQGLGVKDSAKCPNKTSLLSLLLLQKWDFEFDRQDTTH